MSVLPDLSTEAGGFELLVLGFVAVAVLTFPLLFFVSAPYGRHARGGWGPRINATIGWLVMEAPAPIVFAALLLPRRSGAHADASGGRVPR